VTETKLAEDSIMRSSQQVLFPWAFQDRDEELSRFRQMASRWRPVVRCERDDDNTDGFASFDFESSSVRQPSVARPTWSPWLWVK
jgi:hypothetical protein